MRIGGVASSDMMRDVAKPATTPTADIVPESHLPINRTLEKAQTPGRSPALERFARRRSVMTIITFRSIRKSTPVSSCIAFRACLSSHAVMLSRSFDGTTFPSNGKRASMRRRV